MPTPNELEQKFWKDLKSDRTVMLGLSRLDDGHARPMTAQIEGDEGGPIWFFTSNKTELVGALHAGDRAMFTFTAKGRQPVRYGSRRSHPGQRPRHHRAAVEPLRGGLVPGRQR